MKRRRFLIVLLILMVLMMAALAGMFLMLRSATVAPAAVQSPGLKHVESVYGWGKNPDELLSQPFSVAWQNGSIYVSDKGSSQVLRFTPDGQLLARIGSKGREPGQVWSPTGFDVDANGNVFIADGGHNKIVEYDSDGSFVKEAQVSDTPLSLLITANRMFLTTAGSVKVLQLPDMTELTSWGSRGRGSEQWDFPNGIDLDPTSNLIFVGDGNNLRVKALDQQGSVVWIYGHPVSDMNDTDKLFGLAGAVAFADGYVFVTDPLDSVIHILDTKGAEVAQVGDFGSAEGLFSYPSGIAYMGGKRFAIAEWGNARVQIVEIDVPAAIEEWQRDRPANTESQAPTGSEEAAPPPDSDSLSTSTTQ